MDDADARVQEWMEISVRCTSISAHPAQIIHALNLHAHRYEPSNFLRKCTPFRNEVS